MTDTVTVNIYGESYTVKSNGEPEYIKEVADYVDGKMREIASGGKVVVTSKIAILAALNIVDELFKTRQDILAREEDGSRRIEKLLHKLRDTIAE